MRKLRIERSGEGGRQHHLELKHGQVLTHTVAAAEREWHEELSQQSSVGIVWLPPLRLETIPVGNIVPVTKRNISDF